MISNESLQIRDPFIVPSEAERTYYLFGSTDQNIWGKGTGFDVYIGTDLKRWEGPYPAFRPSDDFWSEENFWAPEVHQYAGKFYMLATFKRKDNGIRGTAVLVSDQIQGPYSPHSEGAVTPPDWHCLDGTLYVDDAQTPWLVFCHEWVQVNDGEICAQRLSQDLRHALGDPILLFRASEAPWTTRKDVQQQREKAVFVTDGPFLYPAETGELFLLWSSFIHNVYALGVAKSTSGCVTGPWVHCERPLYQSDGGHGMIFTTFDGRMMLTLHSPNHTPAERPHFLPLVCRNGWFEILE